MKKVFALLFACGLWAGSAQAAGNLDQAIDEAEAALQKADSVGYEWRDSHKILEQAMAAKDEGDTDKALELANQARTQGELAHRQWQDQQGSGPHF